VAKRETMMLAHKFDEQRIGGWYVSQKLDGIRCIWDGGVSAGVPTREVPWANTEKSGRLIKEEMATGLWSRYYKPIYAPQWWIDELPQGVMLDGELYSQLRWQATSKIVKRLDRGGDWEEVRYYVFDRPAATEIFADGTIDIRMGNEKYEIVLRGCVDWMRGRDDSEVLYRTGQFDSVYKWLVGNVSGNNVVKILKQHELPTNSDVAREELDDRLGKILSVGGEGLILRNPYSVWKPMRSHDILKAKGLHDAEGVVIGYVGGKGKLKGLFGAVVLDYNGKRVELSGFTDREREMVRVDSGEVVAVSGGDIGPEYDGAVIKRGDIVTFRYRELSDTGIPKEARYWRKES
jgi:DNA ligase-1